MAAQGRFRADLLDRLAFDVVHVPPLRARPEDIPTLAYHFAVNMTSELKRPFFPGFTPDAQATLLAYEWPGNVRELKNAIERSVYRTDDPETPIESVVFNPFDSPYAPSARARDSERGIGPARSRQARVGHVTLRGSAARFPRCRDSDSRSDLLQRALERAQFKQTTAAKLLGLSYHQLRSLLRKYELSKQGSADEA